MKRISLGQFLVLLLILVLGFVFGAVSLSLKWVSVSNSLTYGNLFQAFATILIGITVAAYLQVRGQTTQKEKDILFHFLNIISKNIDDIEKYSEGGKLTEVTSTLKKLAMANTSLKSVLSELKCSQELIDKACFNEKIRKIRKLSTDTPIVEINNLANSVACNPSVRDGILHLTEERTSLLQNEISDFRCHVLKAQIYINRG